MSYEWMKTIQKKLFSFNYQIKYFLFNFDTMKTLILIQIIENRKILLSWILL